MSVEVTLPIEPVKGPEPEAMDKDTEMLRQMSEQADSGKPIEAPEPAAPAPEAKTESPTPTEAQKPAEEPQRDEQGRFTKADGTKSEPGEKQPTTEVAAKLESAFTKAQKEQQRKEKTWNQIHEERLAIQKEKADWATQKAAEESQRQQRQNEPPPSKFSAAQYDKAADDFAAEARAHRTAGNHEEANQAFDLADKARAAARQVEKEEATSTTTKQQQEFQQVFDKNAAEFAQQVPELADHQSPLFGQLAKLFQEEPMLNFHPNGVQKGYELLQLREKAGKVDAAEAKVAELTAELNRYKGITQIGGAPPVGQTKAKSFDDLSLDEMTDTLRSKAEAADAA